MSTSPLIPTTSSRSTPRSSSVLIWAPWIVPAALAALTILTFYPAIRCDFIDFDDPKYVTENPHILTGLTWASVHWAWTSFYAGSWLPLTWLSLMGDAQIFGTGPVGFHLTNVVLHTTNVVVLYLLLRAGTGCWRRSAIVAAFFAVHPLRVESVAWVTERKDVLSGLFGLSAIALYITYVRRNSLGCYVAAVAMTTLSLMTKQVFVTMPFLLLLLDFWPLKRISRIHWAGPSDQSRTREGSAIALGGGIGTRVGAGRLLVEKAPFLALSIAAALVAIVAARREGLMPLQAMGLGERLRNATISYVQYLGKMARPTELCVYYRYPDRPIWEVVGAALLLVSLTLLAIWRRRRSPGVAVGWFWYLGVMLPTIGLVQAGAQSLADRFTYVPMIGALIMATWLIPQRLLDAPRGKWMAGIILTGALAALCSMTRTQIGYWKNSIALWEHDLRFMPPDSLTLRSMSGAYINAGSALHRAGDVSGAIRQWQRGLAVDPHNMEVYEYVAANLWAQGRAEEAIQCYRRAIAIEPDDADMHRRLATSLLDSGNAAEAIAEYRVALRIDPGLVKAHAGLGAALCRAGKLDEGTAEFAEALRLNPRSAVAHDGLGMALLSQGRTSDAALHFAQAVRIEPSCARCHNNLGVALARLGDLDAAIGQFQIAVNLDPRYQGAQNNLARLRSERHALPH